MQVAPHTPTWPGAAWAPPPAARPSDPAAEYVYVDTAFGGVNKRNHVVTLDRVRPNGQTDCYASYQRATGDLVEHVRTHRNDKGQPTVAGFGGATWTDRLPLDYDHEKDPSRALAWVRHTIAQFRQRGIDPNQARWYFSGGKGFHAELPAAWFGGFVPSKDLHAHLKRAARAILGDIPFDHSIYDKLRLWRLPNTRHGKSGLYKIQLAPDELLTLDYDAIKQLARSPRRCFDPAPAGPVALLVDMWRTAQQSPASERQRVAAAVTDDARDAQTIAAIAASWPRGGQDGNQPSRHSAYVLPVAGFLTGRTDAAHVTRILTAAAEAAGDESFLHGRRWREEIERAVVGAASKRSADQAVTGLPTLAEHFPVLATVLNAIWPGALPVDLGGKAPPEPHAEGRRVDPATGEITVAVSPRRAEREWPAAPGEAAFRGLAGDLVDAIDPHSESDRVALLANVLASFGIAVGGGPYVLVGATAHRARTNYALVGKSAKARKGDSWPPVRAVFERADQEWTRRCIQSGLSSGEGLIAAVRDAVVRSEAVKEGGRVVRHEPVVVDEGVTDKRLLVMESEFARVLKVMGRQGNTLSPVIREAWDSGDLSVMTKTAAKATGTHTGILAHVTVDELRREMSDTETTNGFANRFVWLAVRRSKFLPEPEPFAGSAVDRLGSRVTRALEAARVAGRVERDPDAKALWAEIYADLSKDREGLAGSILNRAEAHVLRLSLTYALLDGSPVITVPHLESALELWHYAEQSVHFIFGDATGDGIADSIYRALREQGEMDRVDITNLLGRHVTSSRIDAALQVLATTGKAKGAKRMTGDRGRPAEVWTPTA
jgi:hypothetical protein